MLPCEWLRNETFAMVTSIDQSSNHCGGLRPSAKFNSSLEMVESLANDDIKNNQRSVFISSNTILASGIFVNKPSKMSQL